MAEDTVPTSDVALDGALERLEQAEADLEAVENLRRHAADEAERAATELGAVLHGAIERAIARRDALEDELAAVLDHIARLEAMRARSLASGAPQRIDIPHASTDEPNASNDDRGDPGEVAKYEDQWQQLMRSREEDSALSP